MGLVVAIICEIDFNIIPTLSSHNLSFRQFFPKLKILFYLRRRSPRGRGAGNKTLSCSPDTSVFLEIFGIKGVFIKIGKKALPIFTKLPP